MKAIGYQQAHALDADDGLQDIVLPEPVAEGHDLLVEVRAVSVNPIDTKIRASADAPEGGWKVLGWDAAGIVRGVGEHVTAFRPGDRVWYAGDISRPGTNAELHRVDERIVGHMPESLDFAQAAALPLTTITAWEMLFDRLALAPGKQLSDDRLLIIGAAGGVGSIMVQLASQLTAARVIGTASRPETEAWVRELGAHDVINHHKPLDDELTRIGVDAVSHVASLTATDQHFPQIVEAIAPQGKFGLIDDPELFDFRQLKRKSVSLHWELMFTRPLFGTEDMSSQQRLLDDVAELVDSGKIRTTLTEVFGTINADNIKLAHRVLESGKARGKIVLEGF